MLFTYYINNKYNKEVDNSKKLDVVMPMHNLIQYNNNYEKTSGSQWQYRKEDPNDNMTDLESFKSNLCLQMILIMQVLQMKKELYY